jgi:hypothetical protein
MDGEIAGSVMEPEVVVPQAAGDTTVGSDERERLAARAYELYLARGGAEGGELDDWLEAERELSGQDSRNDQS